VSLSNGYAYAYWTPPDINVSQALSINLLPNPVHAYSGAPVQFQGAVVPGTGTPPFDSACLSPGDGGVLCDSVPASSWNFSYSYAKPGEYEAALSVLDSGAGNDTALVPVTIYDRPTLAPVSVSYPVIVNTTYEAYANITGGAFPIQYWWNLSNPASTIREGTVYGDGQLVITVVPTVAGPNSLNLTVVDALGTRLFSETQFDAIADTAASIQHAGPPNATASAGSAVAFSYIAVNSLGGRVTAYEGPVTIALHGTGAAAVWVNSSVAGPIPLSSNGTYLGAGSFWRSGFFNFTVAGAVAGEIDVSFAPEADVLGPPVIPVAVGPDEEHVQLVAPLYVHAGKRVNSTYYQIEDRFGNPLPSGSVVVIRSVFGPTVTVVDSPVRVLGATSFVWVNFSASGSDAGTIYVTSTYGEALLPLIAVPASPASPSPLTLPILIGIAAAVLATLAVALAAHYRRRRPSADAEASGSPSSDEGAAVEEELKRLAEGRAHVLAHTPTDHPAGLDDISAGWAGGRPPDTAELSEWIGGLVSEGLLAARVGPDGKPRFVRTEPAPRPTPPRVELDTVALEAALSRRPVEGDGEADLPPEGGPEPDDDERSD
jgi:hypothetical protein